MEFCFYLEKKTGLAKTGAAGPIPLALKKVVFKVLWLLIKLTLGVIRVLADYLRSGHNLWKQASHVGTSMEFVLEFDMLQG